MREVSIDDSFEDTVIASLAICMTTLHFTKLETAIQAGVSWRFGVAEIRVELL
jgi:hypothetical protein